MKIIILGIFILSMLSSMVWADPPPWTDPDSTESPGIVWKWFFGDGFADHCQYRTDGTLLIFVYKVTALGSYIFERTVFCRWDEPLTVVP
jgi:hypothetical protein